MIYQNRDDAGVWLQSAIKYPLLKRDEEIQLSHQIQLMLDEKCKPVGTGNALAIRQGLKARDRLINCNLRLVFHMCSKYQYCTNRDGKQVEMVDLLQEATIGLQMAANKFDPSKGCKFATLAYWWIRQAITRYLNRHNGLIVVPFHVMDRRRVINKAVSKLKSTSNDYSDLTIEKISEITELKPETIKRTFNAFNGTRSLSLDYGCGPDENISLIDLIPSHDQGYSPSEYEILVKRIKYVISLMPKREREILGLLLPLDGTDALKPREAAEILGMSHKNVGETKRRAINKLRARLREKPLIGYRGNHVARGKKATLLAQ